MIESESIKVNLKRLTKKQLVSLVIICSILLVAIIYLYLADKKTASSQLQETIDAVSKRIEIPTDEVPSLAIVKDKNKLPPEVFFKNAQNADHILIFAKSGKVILYRPSSQKIIDVASLNVKNAEASASSTLAPAKIAIYNGTKIVGKGKQLREQFIAQKLAGDIVLVENAQMQDYEEMTVIVLNPRYKVEAEKIAQKLNAKIQDTLPASEKKPEVDILIIAGENNL